MQKFELGKTVATPGCLAALEEAGQSPAEFLARHVAGDWGDLDDEDKTANDKALITGGRIFSAYRTSTKVKIWVITEGADDTGTRRSTCLLLPSEY